MPSRKKSAKKKRAAQGISKSFLFWTAFFVVVVLLFVVNIPKITSNWEKVMGNRFFTEKGSGEASVPLPEPPAAAGGQGTPSVRVAGTDDGDTLTDVLPSDASAAALIPPFAEETPGGSVPADPPAGGDGAARQPVPSQRTAQGAVQPPAQDDRAWRERTVYFVKVDSSGLIFLNDVKRRLPANDSPLVSTLSVLLQGPNEAEKKQGVISAIPPGTRVLGAKVNGNTAVINFSDNFTFNTYGAEGFVAQLKQVIWTATEFPNISEVEFQIEGKKVEYIGDSIRLDRPRNRDSF